LFITLRAGLIAPTFGNLSCRESVSVKSKFLRLFLGPVVLVLIVVLAGCEGNPDYRKGKQQELAKNLDQAVIDFKKALDKNPGNLDYRSAYESARLKCGFAHYEKGRRLEEANKYEEALAEYEQAFTIDRSNDIARDDYTRVRHFLENPSPKKELPSITERMQENQTNPARTVPLSPVNTTPLNLKITAPAKRVYETLSKLAGINVVFDPDYENQGGVTVVSVELNNVTLMDALEILALRTRSYWKPLNANTILVTTDNPTKRKTYEDQIIKTIYLSNSLASTDLVETVNNLRTLFNLRYIVPSNYLNAIIIRDTPDKVAIAERIIQSIDKGKPEVLIDVVVMEIDRNKVRDLGITPLYGTSSGLGATAAFNNYLTGGATPTTSSSTSTGTTTGTTTTTTTVPINRLGHLAGGSWSVAIPSVQAQALISDTNAKILTKPQLRAMDGKVAKIRIGQKVPISTGSFTPFTGGGATAGNIFSQFQYQDIGVNLDVTPKVHLDRDITLEIKVEISSIAGQSNFGGLLQPIFNSRSVDHTITLKEGEANVLAGIISDEDRKVVSGVPGLSQIPIIRWLFSNEHTERNQQEFIIIMTPHIVRLPQFDDINLQGLYMGTDDVVQMRGKLPRLGEVSPVPEAAPAAAAPAGVTQAPVVTLAPKAATPASPQPTTVSPTPTPIAAAPASPQPTIVSPTPTPVAPVGALFRIDPPSRTLPSGAPFTVNISVENIQNFFSASFVLAWDPKVLRLVDAADGGFLGKDNQPIALVQRPDNDTGTVVITLSRPPEVAAMSGSGNLVTLSFEPVGRGRTTLAFSQLFPRTAAGERILATASPGQIIVQ
jgi:general secretion pathway protein D